jgi:hypothetical protein
MPSRALSSFNRHIEREAQSALPEVRLWIACLENAIHDLFGSKVWQPRDDDRREAVEWFLSESHELGSFNFVCSVLGLSPSATRKAVFERKRNLVLTGF